MAYSNGTLKRGTSPGIQTRGTQIALLLLAAPAHLRFPISDPTPTLLNASWAPRQGDHSYAAAPRNSPGIERGEVMGPLRHTWRPDQHNQDWVRSEEVNILVRFGFTP